MVGARWGRRARVTTGHLTTTRGLTALEVADLTLQGGDLTLQVVNGRACTTFEVAVHVAQTVNFVLRAVEFSTRSLELLAHPREVPACRVKLAAQRLVVIPQCGSMCVNCSSDGGFTLGLSVAKRLVVGHGGHRIMVDPRGASLARGVLVSHNV